MYSITPYSSARYVYSRISCVCSHTLLLCSLYKHVYIYILIHSHIHMCILYMQQNLVCIFSHSTPLLAIHTYIHVHIDILRCIYIFSHPTHLLTSTADTTMSASLIVFSGIPLYISFKHTPFFHTLHTCSQDLPTPQ